MAATLNTNEHTVTIPVEDYDRMRLALERYEFVRSLNVSQFKEMLFDRALQDDIPFDKLVDIERAAAEQREIEERKKRVFERPVWRGF